MSHFPAWIYSFSALTRCWGHDDVPALTPCDTRRRNSTRDLVRAVWGARCVSRLSSTRGSCWVRPQRRRRKGGRNPARPRPPAPRPVSPARPHIRLSPVKFFFFQTRLWGSLVLLGLLRLMSSGFTTAKGIILLRLAGCVCVCARARLFSLSHFDKMFVSSRFLFLPHFLKTMLLVAHSQGVIHKETVFNSLHHFCKKYWGKCDFKYMSAKLILILKVTNAQVKVDACVCVCVLLYEEILSIYWKMMD